MAEHLQTWRQPGRQGPLGRRSKYAEEFPQRAAQLVRDSRRSVRDVAGGPEVNHETLRNCLDGPRRVCLRQCDGRVDVGHPEAELIYRRSWPTWKFRLEGFNIRRRHYRLGNFSTNYENFHLTQIEVSAWVESLQGAQVGSGWASLDSGTLRDCRSWSAAHVTNRLSATAVACCRRAPR